MVNPPDPLAVFPTSFAQERMWLLNQLAPSNPSYTIPGAYRLTGPLDVTALERSIREIVRRHNALRTTFALENGQPVQVIAPSATVSLPYINLQHLPENERQVIALRRAVEEADRAFDLMRGPLFRCILFRLNQAEHVLFLVMHHIISDGWSMDVFFRELAALYSAFSTGTYSPLPELPIQYADFALWQRDQLQEELLERQLAYWKEQLKGAAAVELPTDYARPIIQTRRGASETVLFSKELSDAIKTFCQQRGVTLLMTLLAAFKVLLLRLTGQTDIPVGSPIAGRTRVEIENLIGLFVNTLVLRSDLSGTPTFLELLARVRKTTVDAFAHQDLPFERLLQELNPDREQSRAPLFQIFFSTLTVDNTIPNLRGLSVERLEFPETHSRFDMTLYVRENPQGIQVTCVYNPDLFTAKRIREMLVQYRHLASQIAQNPNERVDLFSLVTPDSVQVVPDPVEALAADWHGAVHSLFSEQAAQAPDKLAVIDSHVSWTRRELEGRANLLANRLVAGGIQPQDIVAIYGHRSAPLVWAILGVLKAGAVYTILDPAYPDCRLLDYLRSARPKGWVQIPAAGPLAPELKEFLESVPNAYRITLSESEGDLNLAGPRVTVGPDDVACLTFTSGSTGQPKGVLGRHGPLTHFIPWQKDYFHLCEDDRFSMLSGLSHDAIQRDIFTPLCIGATLYIPDPDTIGTPGSLAEWMARTGITFANMTPPMALVLGDPAAPDNCLPALRYAFFIGDRLLQHDVGRLRRLAPQVTCVNLYGTTETQRALSYYVIPPAPENDRGRAVYSIGRGMPDSQLLVLNAGQQMAGIGELGEIYLRSPHLARGYLRDEPLTQARFLPNPFTRAVDDRVYRTGDLGRYLADGNVEFAGRDDRQVKLRGFRIHLEEIEAALVKHPAVSGAVVVLREDAPGGSRLAAWVVGDSKTMPSSHSLREFLSKYLPDHMIPSVFIFLNEIPLTPNGKIDFDALPAPEWGRRDAIGTFVRPRSPLERQLVAIWEDVIGIRPIGIRDNFFDLGGHSLLAIRMFAKIGQELGKRLPLATLFRSPTIEELAEALCAADLELPDSTIVGIQTCGSRPPLFCVHAVDGHPFRYRALAQYLGDDQPLFALQSPRIGGEHPALRTIEEMAARYIRDIRAVEPVGPYRLAGLSMGGHIAFEMAQQLSAEGQAVALLALLDTPLSQTPHFLESLTLAGRLRYRIRKLITRMRFHLASLTPFSPEQRLEYMTQWLRRNTLGDEDRRAAAQTQMDIIKGLPPEVQEVIAVNRAALREYRPYLYPGKIVLFKSREAAGIYYGWTEIAQGGVEIHLVPGRHAAIVEEPHVQVLAAELKACLDRLSGEGRSL